MDDRDQQQLANRLAEALVSRIGSSLDKGDAETAHKDLEYLLRFEGRGEAARMAELFKTAYESWPDDGASRSNLRHQLQLAEQRVAREVAERRVAEALKNTAVHPLGEPRALQEPLAARIRANAERQPEWSLPPVFKDTWHPMDSKQLLDDIALINRALFQDAFFQVVLQAGVVAGRRCALSCYDATVVEFLLDTPPATSPLSAVFLVGAFGALTMEGTSPRIHALNAQGHLHIDSETDAVQYLKMFSGLVHGEDGPFTIISGREDVMPLLTVPDINALPPVIDTVHPAVITRPDDPDSKHQWVVEATVVYSNAMFKAHFGLFATGMVEMMSDEPIATDLPILQPRFSLGLRQMIQPSTTDSK
jgi:hypothetical protein